MSATREIPWAEEARRRLESAPPFVRPGILKLMQKRATERGKRVISSEFLTEIRNESMLRVARCIKGFGFEDLSMDAFEVAKAKMRKLPRKVEARRRGEAVVSPEAVERVMGSPPGSRTVPPSRRPRGRLNRCKG